MAGALPDGTSFTGTLELKKRMSVKWRKGPKYVSYDAKIHYSTNWDGTGVATFTDNRLYLAVANGVKNLGVLVYHPVVLSDEIIALRNDYARKALQAREANVKNKFKSYTRAEVKGDPWYSDIWFHTHYGVTFKADGFWGIEGLGRTDEGASWPALGPGEWGFLRNYYEDDGKQMGGPAYNTGRLVIAPVGDALVASRYYYKAPKGVHDDGAVLMPDATTLVSVYNGNGTDFVAYYEIVGKALVGKVCDTNPPASYGQTLTVPDKVIERNPGLFK